MIGGTPPEGAQAQLRELVARADREFLQPSSSRPPGHHQMDVAELGLRVSITRARYPNRPDGVDQYAVTLSRPALDRPPPEAEVRILLTAAFGDAAVSAVERPAGGQVRMFRVPAPAHSSA